MSLYALHLFDRAAAASPNFRMDLTAHAPDWTRSTRRIGGFWTGDFTITPATMTMLKMRDLFYSSIGGRLREVSHGTISWEGEIVQIELSDRGVVHRISLDPESWHNKVKCKFAFSETAFSETTASSDSYGESGYIDYLGGTYDSTAATARRDRRLTENAYPRSRPSGGLASGSAATSGADSLHVMAAGYSLGMNRRYQTADIAAANLSTQISTLVGNSEFVTAGIVDSNALSVPVSIAGIEVRLWDQIAELIEMGDASGNRYAGGTYAGRVFNYGAAVTEVTHHWRDNRLYNKVGQLAIPTLIKPDIIVRIEAAPFRPIARSGNAWDDPQNAYIEEVEFIAPDSYRLIPAGGA